MVRFRLKNKTDWNTKDLKKLCHEVMKHADGKERTIINISNSKARCDGSIGWRGEATLDGRWIEMRVIPAKHTDKFDAHIFAQVLEHEIDHNLGLRHREMLPCLEIDVDYVKDFVVRKDEGFITKQIIGMLPRIV